MEVKQRQGLMPAIRRISTCTVRHSRNVAEEERQCHLNPWDLCYLSIHYIQKGLLFRKPAAHPHGAAGREDEQEQLGEGKDEPHIVALLKRSLAVALDLFYPLCGRLATTRHPDDGGAISISIDCGNQGAEFVYAAAPDMTVSDLLAPPFIPHIVRSFFPLNEAVSHEGHNLPLLAVQLTELRDGYFLGCSMNHSAADGTSFWHFFNTWSAVARGGETPPPPVFDRWFPETIRPPLLLPFSPDPDSLIRRPLLIPEMEDAVFHFPRQAIAALKAKANAEGGGGGVTISSLQALLACVWQATTRARNLPPDHTTVYGIAVGLRQRLQPPPPPGYLGNLTRVELVQTTAGGLLGLSLGEVARLLNQGIASQTDAVARRWGESWAEAPFIAYADEARQGFLYTGSSPRFDMYGNDFGWGRPVAVRSGIGNKIEGKLTIYPGADEGSMDLEMSLPREVLLALMADEEFMSVASVGATPEAAAT